MNGTTHLENGTACPEKNSEYHIVVGRITNLPYYNYNSNDYVSNISSIDENLLSYIKSSTSPPRK